MATIDYTKPLSTLLRESTHVAHDQVAMSPGAKLLLTGELSREEYVRYLMLLWHVYDAFESGLDRHATHRTLEPTYNPTLLARAPSLAADISYLLQVDEWKSHPLHKQLIDSAPAPLRNYVERIEHVSKSTDPSPLLAHAYVRYLGDLSGGQIIRHTLAKAYDLDEASGSGISFYAFKELRSSKLASQGEMKRIKDWFREGMNVAGEQGVEVKASIVEEAIKAFALNSDLFTLLSQELGVDKEETRVEMSTRKLTESTFSVSQVIAVVAAVCLTNFILVVGGFTGNAGYEKFLAIEHWFKDLWQQSTTN